MPQDKDSKMQEDQPQRPGRDDKEERRAEEETVVQQHLERPRKRVKKDEKH